ncbi:MULTISPECIES: hypothetical protein [unclassified Arthrobacter]|jgi:hypothetical protein|uniref:hypothetical protein n=1 Tax=unclassified Arthrobacter TaxID=235627 RepID=UPI0025B44622|nr:hypothetical protein [Arthrobacter sp. YD4]MDN3937586.1 hypothetical protein [Arthrobacter sp. YD4]
MPHLLLSTEARPLHAVRSPEAASELDPLRRQVTDIIDAILSDENPDEALVRERLRQHVADNPGQPEKALLNHLLSVSTTVQDGTA